MGRGWISERVAVALFVGFLLCAGPLQAAEPRIDAAKAVASALADGNFVEAEKLLVLHGQQLSSREADQLLSDLSWRRRVVQVWGLCYNGKAILAASAVGLGFALVCSVTGYVLPFQTAMGGVLGGGVGFYIGNRYGGKQALEMTLNGEKIDDCRRHLLTVQLSQLKK